MDLRVGTSGFSYKEWKGEDRFYPPDLADGRMLEYYADRFRTVEINNTFYRMPSERILAGWVERVPSEFRFVIKASRRITHLSRIDPVSCGDSVAYLLDKVKGLGEHLGPLLFQLPPYLRRDVDRLRGFLDLLPEGTRAAIEFRHASWWDDDVLQALRERDVALCHAEGELKQPVPFESSARWGYLRLRGRDYSDEDLTEWASRIAAQDWTEAWVFFKHEEAGAAPRLAERFLQAS